MLASLAIFDRKWSLNCRQQHISSRGPGLFVLPSLLKVKRHLKPKQTARMGHNPMTGEAIKIAAKPARTVVKVLALKALKDTVN